MGTFPIIRRVRDVLLLLLQQEQQEEDEEQEEEGKQPENVDQEIMAPITKKEREELVHNFRKSIYENFTEAFALFLIDDDDDDDNESEKNDSSQSSMAWTIPLDPRLITMSSLSEQEKKEAKLNLIDEVRKLAVAIDQRKQHEQHNQNVLSSNAATSIEGETTPVNNDASTTITGASLSLSSSSSSVSTFTMGGIFWGEDNNDSTSGLPGSTTGTGTTSAVVTRNAIKYAKKNVELYFTTVQSQRQIKDPLLWWKNNQEQFPELALLARKWIASSVVYGRPNTRDHEYDEEVISTSSSSSYSNIESMGQMVFLHDNIYLIGKDFMYVLSFLFI